MAMIYVRRERPPALARCRGKNCGRMVEWVTTEAGRRMPLTSPVRVERMHERDDGTFLSVVEGSQSHFTTCPAADGFRRDKKARRKQPVQQRLADLGGQFPMTSPPRRRPATKAQQSGLYFGVNKGEIVDKDDEDP